MRISQRLGPWVLRSLMATRLRGGLLPRLLQWLQKGIGLDDSEALDLLLDGMAVAFRLSRGYRSNILGFNAVYVFRTREDKVPVIATFADGRLESHEQGVNETVHPAVTITFRNGEALWSFLLNQEIVSALMANNVTVEGNLNYAWRFMFLVRNLRHRALGAVGWPDRALEVAQSPALEHTVT